MAEAFGLKKLFSALDVAHATGGTLLGSKARAIYNVSLDSRTITPESLFVALRGTRVDGHSFLEQALQRGASALLIERDFYTQQQEYVLRLSTQYRASCIIVPHSLRALQELARTYISCFPDLKRVGITGSSGKTTTKELVGSVIANSFPTYVSEGNLNSEIGVPLAIFGLSSAFHYAVFEMGIDHKGEMDVLVELVKPQLAIITNIGFAHLEALGSQENIALEKKKITRYLTADDALFLFEDEPFLPCLTQDLNCKIVTYGLRSTPGLGGVEDLGLNGFAIDWEGLQILFPLVGFHNLHNALAALSLASYLKLPPDGVKMALEKARPLFGRAELEPGAVTILKDCYNANPDSMAKALDFLHNLCWQGRKLAVLGSMKELGKESQALHAKLGGLAAESSLDFAFFFGAEMEEAYTAWCRLRSKEQAFFFTNIEELKSKLQEVIRTGDIVLVKASRAMELERIIPLLKSIN